MKSFALDANGDLLIENNEISMAVGDGLLQQKVWTVLRTNLKEWFFDWEQGVDFNNLLGKETDADLVRHEIERALAQVDETFRITEYTYSADRAQRRATVTFKAATDSGEEAGGEYSWE